MLQLAAPFSGAQALPGGCCKRPQFAVTAGILGVLTKPLPCDTLTVLFNIKNAFLLTIWALMPKIPHFPEAEASQVRGAAGRTGTEGGPCHGALAWPPPLQSQGL